MKSALLAVVLAAGLPVSAQDHASVEHNGVRYSIEKDAAGRVTYLHGGRAFTFEELRDHVAAQLPRKLTPAAEERLARMAPGETIDLVVVLRNQPAAPIARDVWARVQPAADELAESVRRLTPVAGGLPRMSLPRELERGQPGPAVAPAQAAARRAFAQAHDDLMRDARQEIYARIEAAQRPDQDAIEKLILGLGGQVTARVSVMNIVGVRIAAGQAANLAADPRVAQIDLDHPGTPELENHKVSLGLTTGFWAASIDGGVHDVGVLDTGVQQNHPYLSQHPFLSNMGTTDTQTHGTGMAGILASTHPTYTGVAFGLDTIVVALAGSITTSMPGMAYIASTGEPENVNYSFGNGTANASDYTPTDQFFDGVISTFRYMVSKSTGNGGYGTTLPTITHPAPAYNLLASANMNDANTITRADDRIDTSSSRGPTVAGRKKPDITAPGTNSMSCTPSGGFANIGGTSSASPHTGAGFVLLWDLGVMNVQACKAILLNTTDAITDSGTSATTDDQFVPGSLWNRRYGWGYLNLGAAHQHGLDFFVDEVGTATPADRFRLYAGQMFTHEKATVVWERTVAANGSTYPTQIEALSDLDLFAYRQSDNQVHASSTSAIDNVEQLSAPSDALVVLKVKVMGAIDPQVGQEEFGLATQENFAEAAGPAFSTQFSVPGGIDPGETFNISVTVENTGDLPAHAITAQISGATVVNGPDPASVASIPVGDNAVFTWTLQAAATPGTYPLTVAVTSNSYGEVFTGAGAGEYSAGAGGGCYANCDGSTVEPILNVADFTCFLQRFAAGESYANCDGSTVEPVLNVADFTCFLQRFAAGCP